MNVPLNNGENLVLDKDAVFKDPRAASLEWLARRKERQKVELKDYEPEKLYAFKDRLKAKRTYGFGPDQQAARDYKKTMLAKINAELKRRGLRLTRPGDGRVYGPGQAPFQRAGEAAA